MFINALLKIHLAKASTLFTLLFRVSFHFSFIHSSHSLDKCPTSSALVACMRCALKLKLTSIRVSVKCTLSTGYTGYVLVHFHLNIIIICFLLLWSYGLVKTRFGSIAPHTKHTNIQHVQCWRFCLFNNMIL